MRFSPVLLGLVCNCHVSATSRSLETQHFPQYVSCSKDGRQLCTSNDVRNIIIIISTTIRRVTAVCRQYRCHNRIRRDRQWHKSVTNALLTYEDKAYGSWSGFGWICRSNVWFHHCNHCRYRDYQQLKSWSHAVKITLHVPGISCRFWAHR